MAKHEIEERGDGLIEKMVAYLRKIAQGIRERADELTDTIVAEGGKTKSNGNSSS